MSLVLTTLSASFTAAWLTATLASSAAACLFATTLLTAAAAGVGFSTRATTTAFTRLAFFFFGYHEFPPVLKTSHVWVSVLFPFKS